MSPVLPLPVLPAPIHAAGSGNLDDDADAEELEEQDRLRRRSRTRRIIVVLAGVYAAFYFYRPVMNWIVPPAPVAGLSPEQGKNAMHREIQSALSSSFAPPDHDEVDKITFYKPRNAPDFYGERNTCYAYIFCKDSGALGLRLRFHFVDTKWVFVQSVTVLADGQRFHIKVPNTNIFREQSTILGKVWEWVDLEARDTEIAMMETMGKASNVTVRFNGSTYVHDYTVPGAEKESLRAVVRTYRLMQQSQWTPEIYAGPTS